MSPWIHSLPWGWGRYASSRRQEVITKPHGAITQKTCFLSIHSVETSNHWFHIVKNISRISRKERIRNVTIRQQIGLEEPIIKEIEQNQLTWYGHVQELQKEDYPKIALKWMPKQKRAQGRPKKNWMEGIRKAMNERNLNESQWEDSKQWSLGVRQSRTFWNRHTYIKEYSFLFCFPPLCLVGAWLVFCDRN